MDHPHNPSFSPSRCIIVVFILHLVAISGILSFSVIRRQKSLVSSPLPSGYSSIVSAVDTHTKGAGDYLANDKSASTGVFRQVTSSLPKERRGSKELQTQTSKRSHPSKRPQDYAVQLIQGEERDNEVMKKR